MGKFRSEAFQGMPRTEKKIPHGLHKRKFPIPCYEASEEFPFQFGIIFSETFNIRNQKVSDQKLPKSLQRKYDSHQKLFINFRKEKCFQHFVEKSFQHNKHFLIRKFWSEPFESVRRTKEIFSSETSDNLEWKRFCSFHEKFMKLLDEC